MAFVQGDGAREIQDRFDSRRLADAITAPRDRQLSA